MSQVQATSDSKIRKSQDQNHAKLVELYKRVSDKLASTNDPSKRKELLEIQTGVVKAIEIEGKGSPETSLQPKVQNVTKVPRGQIKATPINAELSPQAIAATSLIKPHQRVPGIGEGEVFTVMPESGMGMSHNKYNRDQIGILLGVYAKA